MDISTTSSTSSAHSQSSASEQETHHHGSRQNSRHGDDIDSDNNNDDDNDDNGTDNIDEELPQDEEEATGLMTESQLDRIDFEEDDDFDDDRFCSGSLRSMVLSMTCVLVVATLAVLLPGIRSKSNELEVLRTPARIPVSYECPSQIGTAENYNSAFTTDYQEVAEAITENMTDFLANFRESNFDNWGHTYEAVKEGMYHFKSTYYSPYVQDGSTIYESACGIGLNLYMTLEILRETKGIENLWVYGNEYIEVSADKANAVLDHVAPARGRKGIVCQGDSTDLGFVPENAFDLVYTGYLSPLLDPLHFEIGTNENYDFYTALCLTEDDDWRGKKLNEISQQRQDDWYGKWVAEMARIAKPGVAVIVEQVSPRYCDAKFDWGGVNKDWWKATASNNTYGWNVNPESIVIEGDTIFRSRYHVFMLKNGKREAQ